jgi:hypothetical protein
MIEKDRKKYPVIRYKLTLAKAPQMHILHDENAVC